VRRHSARQPAPAACTCARTLRKCHTHTHTHTHTPCCVALAADTAALHPLWPQLLQAHAHTTRPHTHARTTCTRTNTAAGGCAGAGRPRAPRTPDQAVQPVHSVPHQAVQRQEGAQAGACAVPCVCQLCVCGGGGGEGGVRVCLCVCVLRDAFACQVLGRGVQLVVPGRGDVAGSPAAASAHIKNPRARTHPHPHTCARTFTRRWLMRRRLRSARRRRTRRSRRARRARRCVCVVCVCVSVVVVVVVVCVWCLRRLALLPTHANTTRMHTHTHTHVHATAHANTQRRTPRTPRRSSP
jgi:hypothetical protein